MEKQCGHIAETVRKTVRKRCESDAQAVRTRCKKWYRRNAETVRKRCRHNVEVMRNAGANAYLNAQCRCGYGMQVRLQLWVQLYVYEIFHYAIFVRIANLRRDYRHLYITELEKLFYKNNSLLLLVADFKIYNSLYNL